MWRTLVGVFEVVGRHYPGVAVGLGEGKCNSQAIVMRVFEGDCIALVLMNSQYIFQTDCNVLQ